jgi:hypothetical protein
MQSKQIIAKSPWYEVWREAQNGGVKVTVKYADRVDPDIYSTRAIEVAGDLLIIHTSWNLPGRRGERVTAVRIPLDLAAYLRGRLMTIESVRDFEGLLWEIDDVISPPPS